MAMGSRSCPSCGARVPEEADQCTLCGTELDRSSNASEHTGTDDASTGEEAARERPEGEEEASGVFCNQCGWENPSHARYCSKCGSKLQDMESSPAARPVEADLPGGSESAASSPSPEPSERPDQAAMGRRIGLVVGGAVALVLGLFFVTQWSTNQSWSTGSPTESTSAESPGTPPSGGSGAAASSSGPMAGSAGQGELIDLQQLAAQTADSLTGSLGEQVDSLRQQIQEATEEDQRRLQADLVNLLIGAGQPGRAAVLQRDIAEATGTVEDRRRAADLLYRWMQKLQQEGQRKQVFEVARHAAQAYGAVVEKRPDDLDARTRMGEAYLLTNEPMQGIETINAVLTDDSTFVPARFQKGLALLQINRLDQALEQFEKVKRDAEEGSPFYRQADRAVQVIRKQRASSSGASPGANSSP